MPIETHLISYRLEHSPDHVTATVNLYVTSDTTSFVDPTNTYSLVTAVSGTYDVYDSSGTLTGTSNIIGLVPAGGFLQNDNYFRTTYPGHFNSDLVNVDSGGISFKIDNPTFSDDGLGNVNFSSYLGPPLHNFRGDHLYSEGGNPEKLSLFVQDTNGPVLIDYSVDNLPVCFCTATMIRTISGDIPVEKLSVGDAVVTAAGSIKLVKWIGSREIDYTREFSDLNINPVRISVGALGNNIPDRPLCVSPGHGICITCLEDILVPAGELVNGATITRVNMDSVTYWHVELEGHDLLISNNLPTESYIDVGNRAFFESTDDLPIGSEGPDGQSDQVCPRVLDTNVISAIRSRLRARAVAQGWRLNANPALRIETAAGAIWPTCDEHAQFEFDATATEVAIISEVSVPWWTSDNVDERSLGICIKALIFRDDSKNVREIAMDHPLLSEGFYSIESNSDYCSRWTNGRARLPSSLWDGLEGKLSLTVELACPAPAHWCPPAQVNFDQDAETQRVETALAA